MSEEQKNGINLKMFLEKLPLNLQTMDIPELERLANQGNQDAMCELVRRYSPPKTFLLPAARNPNETIKDPTKAFNWVKKLVEYGNWQGRYWLADCYFSGHHVEKADPEAAIHLLKENADQNHVEAWVRLAYYYSHGRGIESNCNMAMIWLEKIFEWEESNKQSLGDQFRLNNVLQKNYDFCPELGFEYEEPRYQLAEMYFKGRYGVEKNLDKAIIWLKRAIEWQRMEYDEKCRAQLKLGECYLQGGYGLTQDYDKAIVHLKNAAECCGHCIHSRNAQRELARCYYLGSGVRKDYAEAIRWLEKSLCDAEKIKARWGVPFEDAIGPHAHTQAELGLCHYMLERYENARECFELSSVQNGWLGWLWLTYLDNCINDQVFQSHNFNCFAKFRSMDVFYHPTAEDEASIKIDRTKNEIDQNLHKAAAGFERDIARHACPDNDILDFYFPDEIIAFLTKHESANGSSPAKVILAIYYQSSKHEGKYLRYLNQASICGDIIAKYLLGVHFKHTDYDRAIKHFTYICDSRDSLSFSNNLGKYSTAYTQELILLAKDGQNDVKLEQKRVEQEKIRADEEKRHRQELEDMMAMFAHKFRSPLDAIIYNTTHDNQVKLYTEAAQTMRGLLDVFSIISTDTERLRDKIRQDIGGKSSLSAVTLKTLDMLMLHLLSPAGAEKIHQHYLAYAEQQGLCPPGVNQESWQEDYWELEQRLQSEWEQSFAKLLSHSEAEDWESRQRWIEARFFRLLLRGFDHNGFRLKPHGAAESFLTILLNEVLVNAFKYYSSATQQPVVLEWAERDGWQVLTCYNPSIRSERMMDKGSGKGHTFLSTLARKTGSRFDRPKPHDDFVLEFAIPGDLFIAH